MWLVSPAEMSCNPDAISSGNISENYSKIGRGHWWKDVGRLIRQWYFCYVALLQIKQPSVYPLWGEDQLKALRFIISFLARNFKPYADIICELVSFHYMRTAKQVKFNPFHCSESDTFQLESFKWKKKPKKKPSFWQCWATFPYSRLCPSAFPSTGPSFIKLSCRGRQRSDHGKIA